MSTVTSAAAPAPVLRGSLSLTRLSDELLARQTARGSDRAFAVLYERYYPPVYRYCRSIVQVDADAQDVLQSTFASALSALRAEKRNAPLRPWLYRIAHNEAVSLLRRRSRQADQEITEASAPPMPSAEQEAAGRARWALLVEDLAGLPERQRSALVMRELSGLSHEEIAIALGTNVGGAKQAIFEARQGLMELAKGRAMSCDDVRRRLSAGDRRVLRGRRVRAHLRDCGGCAEFAAAIGERRAELRAFAPALPSAAAAAVLARTLGTATAHGGASGAAAGSAAAGSAAATAGAVGKAAGTALTWKALTGVAVVAAATAGATGIQHALRDHHARANAAIRAHRAAVVGGARAAGSARRDQIAVPSARGQRATASGAAVTAHGSPVVVAVHRAPASATLISASSATGRGNGASHRAAAAGSGGRAATAGHVRAGGHAAPTHAGTPAGGRTHSASRHAPGSAAGGARRRGKSTAAPGHAATTSTLTTPGRSQAARGR